MFRSQSKFIKGVPCQNELYLNTLVLYNFVMDTNPELDKKWECVSGQTYHRHEFITYNGEELGMCIMCVFKKKKKLWFSCITHFIISIL